MSKKNTLLTFKGNCMNFLLELNFFILSHPLTSKQPRKIVQIHMHHTVGHKKQVGRRKKLKIQKKVPNKQVGWKIG